MIYEEEDKLKNESQFSDFTLTRPNNEFFEENATTMFRDIESDFYTRILDKLRYSISSISSDIYIYDQKLIFSKKLLKVINYLKRKKIVKRAFFRRNFNDEFQTHKFAIEADLHGIMTDGVTLSNSILGSSSEFDANIAVSKAIGEFLERYCSSIYRENDLYKFTINDLIKKNKKFVNPDSLSVLTESQRKKRKLFYFDNDTKFLWTEVSDLDDKKFLIPAQTTLWTYNRKHKDFVEPILRETNTNGAAGFFNKNGAILAGIYEIIQRDAFMRYWLTATPPPKINNIENPLILEIINKAKRLNFKIDWYYTGNELKIPSVICLLTDLSGVGPKLSVGGGGGASLLNAMINSFTEVAGLYSSMRLEGQFSSINVDEVNFKDVNHLERLRLWGNSNMYRYAEFFLKGENISFSDINVSFQSKNIDDELEMVRERVESLGDNFKIYYFETNNQILSELGYSVVKVVIPAMVNLFLRERYRPGYISSQLTPSIFKNGTVNTIPHPFP